MPDLKTVKRGTNIWSRTLHVYMSMAAFLLVLFFGITGITLNHPTWSIGDSVTMTTKSGTLPMPVTTNGAVDYLSISEYARNSLGASGDVQSHESTDTEARITYRKPGYSADIAVDLTTGEYTFTADQQGMLGVLNDLHKGRYADSAWKWLIDVAGLLLVLISITGVVLQLFLRKRRTSAFIVAGAGAVLMLLLAWIALS